jgi:hypothetical protein
MVGKVYTANMRMKCKREKPEIGKVYRLYGDGVVIQTLN